MNHLNRTLDALSSNRFVLIDGLNLKSGGAIKNLKVILTECMNDKDKLLSINLFTFNHAYREYTTDNLKVTTLPSFLNNKVGIFLLQVLYISLHCVLNKKAVLFAPSGLSFTLTNPNRKICMFRNMLYENTKLIMKEAFPLNLFLLFNKASHEFTMHTSSTIICLTDTALELLRSKYGQNKRYIHLPHPYSTVDKLNQSNEWYNTNSDQLDLINIVYPSHFSGYKRQLDVCVEFHHFITNCPDKKARLHLVGASNNLYTHKVRQYILKHNLHNCINLHPPMPHSKLLAFCMKMDFFVFSSSCENYPNLFIELYCLGKPLICNCIEPLMTEFPSVEGYFMIDVPGSLARSFSSLSKEYNPNCIREQVDTFSYAPARYYSILADTLINS